MIGRTLANRYEIQRELGKGGMGNVYLAYDPVLEREVAIKYLSSPPTETLARQRFLKEARLIAQMNHPNIVQIFDFYPKEESPFFVMPVLRGWTLREHLQEHQSLSIEETYSLGIQIAQALEHSHGCGVIHRDIKPENIFLTPTDEGFHVRVLDFGVALVTEDAASQPSNGVTGTFWYLSPEQLTGELVDERSDLYALGSVLYECLVGKPPFHDDIQAMLQKVSAPQPPPLQRLMPGLAADKATASWELSFTDQIMRCLQKDPVRRFSSARSFRRAFVIHQYEAPQPDTPAPLAPPRTPPPPTWTSEPGTPLPSLPTDPHAPLCIGRERELGELLSKLDLTTTGHCHIALITGPSGIGKTHLVETLAWATQHNVLTLKGDCAPHNRSSHPFQAFGELLQDFCRQHSSSPKHIVKALGDLAPALQALFPDLGFGDSASSPPLHSPQTFEQIQRLRTGHRGEVIELIAVALQKICERQPTIAVLESIDASSPTIDALLYMFHRLQRSSLLLLATSTTDQPSPAALSSLTHELSTSVRFAQLHLKPLSLEHQIELLRLIAPTSTAAQRRSWAHRAKGNPKLLCELIDQSQYTPMAGMPQHDQGSLRQTTPYDVYFTDHPQTGESQAFYTPDDIPLQVGPDAETLDDLPALTPYLLAETTPPAWGQHSSSQETPPPPTMAPGASSGAFSSGSLAGMSPPGPFTPSEEFPSAPQQAPSQPPELPQMAEQLGDMLLIQGKYLAARDAYNTAQRERQRAKTQVSYVKEAYTLQKLALINYSLGHYDETLALCQSGLALVDTAAPKAAAALEAWCSLACTAAGELQAAGLWLEKGTARLTPSTKLHREGAPPVPDEQLTSSESNEQAAQQAETPTEDLGSAAVESLLYRAKGELFLVQDQPHKAIEAYRLGLDRCEHTQDEWEYSIGLLNTSEAYIHAGQLDQAKDFLWQAIKKKSALGDRWGLAHTHRLQAQIYLEEQRWDDAAREAAYGITLAQAVRAPKLLAKLYVLQATLQEHKEAREEALQSLQMAMHEAERAFAKNEWLQAAIHIARLRQKAGQWEEVGGLLKEVETVALSLASPMRTAEVHRLKGEWLLAKEKPAEATAQLLQALEVSKDVARPQWQIDHLTAIASSLQALEHHMQAVELRKQAQALAEDATAPQLQAALTLAESRYPRPTPQDDVRD